MNKKIITIKKAKSLLLPNKVCLLGSSFEPFNEYYLRLLKWSSAQARPLVAVVQKDEAVALRRGLEFPKNNEKWRAEIVASLEFVDYVIISDKVAHDDYFIKLMRPKVLIIQRDYPFYIKKLVNSIKTRFPDLIVKLSPIVKNKKKSKNGKKIESEDYIIRKLIELSRTSEAEIGKISSLLLKNDKIFLSSVNSKQGQHAELLLFKKARQKHIDFKEYSLITLIPPCIMCAEEILKIGLKKVFYLYDYGDRYGLDLLRSSGINVSKYMKSKT